MMVELLLILTLIYLSIIATLFLRLHQKLISHIIPPKKMEEEKKEEVVEEMDDSDVIPGSVGEEIELSLPDDTVEEQEWKEEQKRKSYAAK